jgi:hypothetical protein
MRSEDPDRGVGDKRHKTKVRKMMHDTRRTTHDARSQRRGVGMAQSAEHRAQRKKDEETFTLH